MTDRPATQIQSEYTHPLEWRRPRPEPPAKTVEDLEEKLVRFEAGDWRATMARAVGTGWITFFQRLTPEKVSRLFDALYGAATSKRSSTRVQLRAAEQIMKILAHGTKAMADLATLAGSAAAKPEGDNLLTVDMGALDAVEQMEEQLAVLRRIRRVKPVQVTVEASPGDADGTPAVKETT